MLCSHYIMAAPGSVLLYRMRDVAELEDAKANLLHLKT